MLFPAPLILIQKLPLSAMMTDGRAIAICGQMLPGFIEHGVLWKGGWYCMEVLHVVHAMVWYGFMDHLGMSLCQS